MRRVVLDASVILKWYLTDENYGAKAMDLLFQYTSNELEILAPSLLEYELVNGLLIAQRKSRIKEEDFVKAIEGFIDLGIKLIDLSAFYSKLLHFFRDYQCSIYDASYLAIADKERIMMITSNRELYNMVKRDLKWVKWIGDI